MNRILRVIASGVLIIGVAVTTGSNVFAASSTNVTQTINMGTLASDIRDASHVSVASPTFALSSTSFSFDCQTTTGTLGTNSQRVYVDNPGAANSGWTVTAAATSGATAKWQNAGVTQTFDFNDSTSAGCVDGGDIDSVAGQLTLDPSVGTLTADCTGCTTANITKGSSTGFSEGTTNSVTLLNASASSDDAGRWYLTGVGLSQTIPAEQYVDSYTLNLTITTTAS